MTKTNPTAVLGSFYYPPFSNPTPSHTPAALALWTYHSNTLHFVIKYHLWPISKPFQDLISKGKNAALYDILYIAIFTSCF